MKYAALILIGLLLLSGCVEEVRIYGEDVKKTPTPTPTATPAADSVKSVTTDTTKTVINGTTTTFSDIDNKYTISSTTYINNTKFVPVSSDTIKSEPEWSTENSVVKFSYELKGSSVKETVVLKEPKDLKFDITVNKGNVLIPWFNGEYKIVEETFKDTMTGIVIAKPYGIDANGNYIEMEYIQSGNVLELKYDNFVQVLNKSYVFPKEKKDVDQKLVYITVPVAYPLTIDPTWTYVNPYYSTTVGSDTVLMWNTTGTYTNGWTAPTGVTSVWYLVVAGGGGGGGISAWGYGSGGGGAGGLLNNTIAVTPGNQYNIVVGTGGNAGASTPGFGGNGTNSSFSTVAAKYGGGGAGYDGTRAGYGPAGSGGGGVFDASTGGAGVAGQGNNGGGVTGSNGYGCAGGGGGASTTGQNGVSGGAMGRGGNGTAINITGELTTYAGGGGAGSGTATQAGAVGGTGGGGTGGACNANVGSPGSFYGGGGGGGSSCTSGSAAKTGGAGYQGVVIIRYTTPAGGDTTPPASLSNIANATTCNSINFTWTNPSDADFNGTYLWLNGTAQTNLSKTDTFKLVSSLGQNLTVTFASKTFDNASPANVNTTFQNHTARTLGTPVASFTKDQTTGVSPLTVSFTDTSALIPSAWNWTYQNVTGDNIERSFNTTSATPIQIFTTGNYSIKLNASNGCGYNITPGLAWVNVTAAAVTPVSAFSANVTGGSTPLSVGFTDSSENSPTNWDWYWFDNETKSSDLQNPTNVFLTGTYNVRLYTSNTAGGDWENKTSYITVNAPSVNATYYLYGDSTAAGPISDYDNNMIMKFKELYHPGDTAYHNEDGSGQSSSWGVSNLATHMNATNEYLLFGVNDMNGVNLPSQVATNLDSMADTLEANGVTANIMIQVVVANDTFGYGYSDFVNQNATINQIQQNLTAKGRTYIKTYDAIDIRPCNGIADPANLTLLSDPNSHPGDEANLRIANYLGNSTAYCEEFPDEEDNILILIINYLRQFFHLPMRLVS